MKTMFVEKLKHLAGAVLLAGALCATAASLLPGARGQAPVEPARSAPAGQAAADQPPAVHKLLEAIDWRLTDVDAAQATIGLSDHLADDKLGKVIIATGKGGVAASGLRLSGLRVAADATITLDGKQTKLADLKPGLRVTLRVGAGGAIAQIIAATPRPPVFRCVLKSVDVKAGTIAVTLVDRDLELIGLPVAKDAEIHQVSIAPAVRLQPAGLGELKAGAYLDLHLAAGPDGRLAITSIWASKPGE